MLYLDDLFSHNIVFKLHQKIIDLTDHACRGIFYGEHGKISTSLIDCHHRIPEGIHMKAVDLIPEILMHGSLGIGSFRSLKYHSRLLRFQTVHFDERKLI